MLRPNWFVAILLTRVRSLYDTAWGPHGVGTAEPGLGSAGLHASEEREDNPEGHQPEI